MLRPQRTSYVFHPDTVIETGVARHARDKLLYHEVAPIFEEVNDRNTLREVDFVDDVIHKYLGAAKYKVLDLGCGVGRHAKYLMTRYQVTGIDASPDMLKVFRKNCPGVPYWGIDMRELGELAPLRDQRFDVAMCMWTTLNYLSLDSEVQQWFNDVHKLLSPGGIVIIDLKNGDNLLPYKERKLTLKDGRDLILRIFKEKIVKESGTFCHTLYVYQWKDSFWVDQEVNRIYTPYDMCNLSGSGYQFRLLTTYGDYSIKSPLTRTSERTIVVMKRI